MNLNINPETGKDLRSVMMQHKSPQFVIKFLS